MENDIVPECGCSAEKDTSSNDDSNTKRPRHRPPTSRRRSRGRWQGRGRRSAGRGSGEEGRAAEALRGPDSSFGADRGQGRPHQGQGQDRERLAGFRRGEGGRGRGQPQRDLGRLCGLHGAPAKKGMENMKQARIVHLVAKGGQLVDSDFFLEKPVGGVCTATRNAFSRTDVLALEGVVR